MSTGLTFGTISSLYGLSHGIVSKEQYSFLVATVIASAVIPTLIEDEVGTPTENVGVEEVVPEAEPEPVVVEETPVVIEETPVVVEETPAEPVPTE